MDDLDVEMWIPLAQATDRVVNVSDTRIYVEQYPETGLPLPFPCTVFYEDQRNYQDDNLTIQSRLEKQFKGNIIVMRNCDRDSVTNMSEEDLQIAEEVVRQYVSETNHGDIAVR